MKSEKPTRGGSADSASKPLSAAAEAERQFREEVLPDELDYVRDRRASHGFPPDEKLAPGEVTRNSLLGLALSGGGIRSATFNLGILQALDRQGLFRHIDYLSTVSGGGFIGSSLSALLSEKARKAAERPAPEAEGGGAQPPGTEPAAFPFPHTQGSDEVETVRYLRGHSDYLAPQGLTDRLRAFALLSRGIALNFVLLLPILLIISLLGMVFFVEDLMAPVRDAWVEAQAEPDSGAADTAAETSPEPPLAVLDSGGGTPTYALTYAHGEGLQLWDLRHLPDQPPPPRPYKLWTDSSPIVAAAFSPGFAETGSGDLPRIAAAGADGSIWLFYPEDPEDPGGGLRRASGRLRAPAPSAKPPLEGPRLTGIAFSSPPDTSRLFAETRRGKVLACSIPADRDEPADLKCPQVAASPEIVFGTQRPESVIEAVAEAEENQGSAWDPRSFRLPRTAWTLVWLTVLFVGLYPLSVLLGGLLERLAAGVTSGFRRATALLRAMRRRERPAEARARRPRMSRGMVASLLVAAFGLLLPLALGGSIRWWFEKLPLLGQRDEWPTLGFSWLGFAWILSVLLLVPALRRWRPREPPSTAGDPGPPPPARPMLAALLLLLPWAPLLLISQLDPAKSVPGSLFGGGLGEFFMPVSGFWSTGELPSFGADIALVWLIVPLWWIACLALLKPLLFPPKTPATQTPESQLEWHRRVTTRLYVAANLLLWVYLILVAYHHIPLSVLKYMVGSYVSGFGFEDSTITMLTPLAFLGYLAMLEFLLWKAFARLARGRVEPTAGHDVSAKQPAAKPAPAGRISWRERYEKAFSLALMALAGMAFFEIQPFLVHHYHALKVSGEVAWLYFLAAASFLAIVLAAMFFQAIKGVGRKVVLLCLGLLGPVLPFIVYLSFVEALVYSEGWFRLRWLLFGPLQLRITMVRVFFLIVTVSFVAYLLGKLIDANLTGMHGFYRDRLSQGFLVGVDRDGVIGPEEELSLLDICPEGSGAPYHLISASLNMQGESAGALRWRNSDFFVFSKRWCGGPNTEYCLTEQLESVAPDVHLASAMAVSAAAAAPNMGSYTSGFLVMLMTLLNVRLGLWLPSPRRLRRMGELGLIGSGEGIGDRLQRWWLRLKNRPSGYYLVNEMASRLDASGPYVNLSDGGHLENTGAYELLRRRCRFIVIGDADSDPGMSFGSLATLMRYASIDLGIEIEIDPGPLRLGEAKISAGHYAVGKIHYPPPPGGTDRETGVLLYVKTSVVGAESEIIREYRARHEKFPQESTADQVFEEDQFEAYRALGLHIGTRLFDARGGEPLVTPSDVESFFSGLEAPAAAASPAL